MMKALINNERHIIVNTIRTQPTRNLVSYGLLGVILAFFLYFISRGVWAVSSSITPQILSGMLSYIFLLMIGFIILLGLPQVFKQMYSSTDLQLLFTMPIQTRHIFWVKYIQSFAGIPLFAFIFFIVPLFVYGIASQVSLLYYPVVLIILLAVALIGLSIAYLFNLILIQIVPASRANEFMTVMSFLSGIFVYLLFMFPNMNSDIPMMERMLDGVPLLPKWVPITWGSTAVVEATQGSIGFLLPLFLFALFVAMLIVLSTTLVEKGFRTGWIRLSEGGAKTRKKRKTKGIPKVQHPIIAIGKKEWYAIKRDMREWLVLMPIAFFFIFGIVGAFSGGDINISEVRAFSELTWPIGQGVLLLMYSLINGTISASSIGREGPSAWVLRVLPVRGTDIAYGKLWISWLIPFIIFTAIEIVVGIFLNWTFVQLTLGIAMKGLITIGSSAIGLWLGTVGAKYHPTNPQARLKFGTSLFLFVLSYVYLIIALIPYVVMVIPAKVAEFGLEVSQDMSGFFGFVFSTFTQLLVWKGKAPVLMISLSIVTMLMISLGIMYIFTRVSAHRIDRGVDIDMVSEQRSKPLFGGRSGKSDGSLY